MIDFCLAMLGLVWSGLKAAMQFILIVLQVVADAIEEIDFGD